MKMRHIATILLLGVPLVLNAQNERKYVRQGVKAYDEKTYPESEIAFRKALDADSTSLPAGYDMGNALYKQNKYKDAGAVYQRLAAEDKDADDTTVADIYHNLGNSYLKQGDYAKSIEAYKHALRLRPADDATRYNLVYAQAKLREQQQQQKNQNNQNQNNKNQKNQKNQEKKDQNQQNKNQQDQQNQEQQKQQQQQQQQQQNQQEQQKQGQKKNGQEMPEVKKQMSKEEIQKMLQAIQMQELQTLKKYEKQKAKANQVKTDKDW